jgi:hypothetical protein
MRHISFFYAADDRLLPLCRSGATRFHAAGNRQTGRKKLERG